MGRSANLRPELWWRFRNSARRAGAGGKQSEIFTETYRAIGSLAYRPGHLRADRIGDELHITWTKRGPEVSPSWALPEADNSGNFSIQIVNSSENIERLSASQPHITVPWSDTLEEVRVSQIGPDGRSGTNAVLSIPVGLT